MEYFEELSIQDKARIWGDRQVLFVDAANMLRPRPECYRKRDKVHALELSSDTNQYLMHTGHGKLIEWYGALRAKMGP
jgi:hypothetical protein